MTPIQAKIYSFIVKFWRVNGYAPTLQEIADETGMNHRAHARHHVNNLVDRGILKRTAGAKRSIMPADMSLKELRGD